MWENIAHRTNIEIIFCIIKIPENLKLKLPNFKQLPCVKKLLPLLESGKNTRASKQQYIHTIFSKWINHEDANTLRQSVCNYAMVTTTTNMLHTIQTG